MITMTFRLGSKVLPLLLPEIGENAAQDLSERLLLGRQRESGFGSRAAVAV